MACLRRARTHAAAMPQGRRRDSLRAHGDGAPTPARLVSSHVPSLDSLRRLRERLVLWFGLRFLNLRVHVDDIHLLLRRHLNGVLHGFHDDTDGDREQGDAEYDIEDARAAGMTAEDES